MGEYIDVFKRTEIKYLLSEEQYIELLSFLKGIARVDEYGETRINNIYFDTPDYRLIRTSLEKPIYKEKLRLRTYGTTEDGTSAFIEIKKKYDGVVYKRRIGGTYRNAFDYLVNEGEPIDDSQISKEIEGMINMYEDLSPSMKICYDRVAMVGINNPELRITFDKDIEWSNDDMDLRSGKTGNPILKNGQRLMEIKVANSMPMEIATKLSELSIFPSSFSKYGRGYVDMISRYINTSTVVKENNEPYGKEVIAYA